MAESMNVQKARERLAFVETVLPQDTKHVADNIAYARALLELDQAESAATATRKAK